MAVIGDGTHYFGTAEFEDPEFTGDWDGTTVQNSGVVDAHGDAAKNGSYGSRHYIPTPGSTDRRAYGLADADSEKTEIFLSLWLNINDLTMADADEFSLVKAVSGNHSFTLFLRRDGSNYEISSAYYDGGHQNTSWLTITKADWHKIQMYGKAETGGSTEDGIFKIWIDDVEVFSVTDAIWVDTQTFQSWNMGFIYGVEDGTEQYIYIDDVDIYASYTEEVGDFSITVDGGSYALTGQTTNLLKGSLVEIDAGSYALTGQVMIPLKDSHIDIVSGSYALGGQTVDLLKTHIIGIVSGSYALSGQSVGLFYGWRLAINAGSYSLSGQVADLLKGSHVDIVSGSYSLGGQVVSLLKGSLADIVSGSYALSGQVVGLLKGSHVDIVAGSYSLSGQVVSLLKGSHVDIASGSYALTGQTVNLLKDSLIEIDSGVYVLTGQAVTLIALAALLYKERLMDAFLEESFDLSGLLEEALGILGMTERDLVIKAILNKTLII